MRSSNTRRRRSHGRDASVWLRRNVWLVAASTLVVIYCVFMVYTTMWARGLDAVERVEESDQMAEYSNAMQNAMTALKEMGAIRGENTHEEAEEQAEEAAENGREQLVNGEGEQENVGEEETHNAHAAATTTPRLRTETEDTVAYDDKMSLDDAGDIPMVGTTVEAELETLTSDKNKEDQETTSPRVAVASDNKGPAPLMATVSGSDHLWTGADKVPVVGTQLKVSMPDTISSAIDFSSHLNSTQAVQVKLSDFKSRQFDKSRLVLETPEQLNASIPFDKRHHVIFGYNATLAYLQLYTKPIDSKEELFLFFTCSGSKGGRDDWNPNCATAREKVYATFAKSPSTNRLVTIHAGPREDWMGGNAFTDDDDLRLKAVPTLMRWDGGKPGALRSTWGVLVDNSILYEPLVRYLFRNADEQDKLLAKPEVETKEIVTLRGYAQYRAYVESYANDGTSYPLFMMMVSGRFQRNNRLWCPWCRQSEMPVEYAFYAYAPANAKLVLVETYDKYSEWRNPENAFKKDPQLAMKGVPWFYRVYPGPPGAALTYQRVKKKFYILEALQQVFEDSG
ncbi:Eukaryotic hypothetical protein [Phytophthora infestans]|uniref:Thioredoxin domain-containing protein n=1 Tax=Phytophthora infestans TaxID=4787 RepID=A0A8S9TU60_PHYIN|nr:Eukaryotic hypothetical protein [Phytophthora infestans]